LATDTQTVPPAVDIDRMAADRDRLHRPVGLGVDAHHHRVLGRTIDAIVAGHPEVAGADNRLPAWWAPIRIGDPATRLVAGSIRDTESSCQWWRARPAWRTPPASAAGGREAG
jgi:hypothetical protein